jgi:SagB-type dehydrogenase family enzyme
MPPATILSNVITLLFSCGLLENGLSPPATDGFEDLDGFLGRFADVTRNNQNRGEAMERLRNANIAVYGSRPAAEMIAIQLAESCAQPRILATGAAEDLVGAQLLIAVATRADEDLSAVLTAAQATGVPVLHVRIGETQAQIGPIFIPGRSGCYPCMQALHALPKGDANPLLLQLWLSLAALQAVHFVSRIADIQLFGGFESYEQTADGIVHQHRYVARLPGRTSCGIDGAPLDQASPEMLAWLYHCSVGMPPREVGTRRAHQRHYLAQNIAETNRLPEAYAGGAIIPLPRGELIDGLPSGRMKIDSLATLLKHAAGHRKVGDDGLRRIAPTGGGMGSPELFVVANKVDGLRSGVYHYYAPHHFLERLDETKPAEISAALGIREWVGACAIVGVGALQKLRSKYQNFAYCIVNLDAGIALRFLYQMATALRIRAREQHGIHDEATAQLIGVPRKDNQYVVTFALMLDHREVEPAHEHPKFGVGMLDALISESAYPRRAENHPVGEPAGAGAGGLVTHILSRRSVRSFGGQSVSKSALEFLASIVNDADRNRFHSGAPGVPLRQWWLLRVGSPQLDAGVYEFDPASKELLPRGPDPTEDDLRQCLNQTMLAAAPAILVLTGGLGRALRSRGARGYREMLLQAGSACGSLLIAAESLGLGACTTVGIIENGFRRLTMCDGYNDCPAIAVSLGYASER